MEQNRFWNSYPETMAKTNKGNLQTTAGDNIMQLLRLGTLCNVIFQCVNCEIYLHNFEIFGALHKEEHVFIMK